MSAIMPDSNIPVNTNYSHSGVVSKTFHVHNTPMENLRTLRQVRRLSQVQLAEIVGCTQGMISKIEKGSANPTLDLIEEIASALKVTPVALFGLPEAQQRALMAFDRIHPSLKASALTVLEKMAED